MPGPQETTTTDGYPHAADRLFDAIDDAIRALVVAKLELAAVQASAAHQAGLDLTRQAQLAEEVRA